MIDSVLKIIHNELEILRHTHLLHPFDENANYEAMIFNPVKYFNERFSINEILRKRALNLLKETKKLIKRIESVDLKNDLKEVSKIISSLQSLKMQKNEIKELENLYEEKTRRFIFEQIQPIVEFYKLESISMEQFDLSLRKLRSYNQQINEAIKAVYEADKIKLLEIIK
jgi:DNA primase catalytic subunit